MRFSSAALTAQGERVCDLALYESTGAGFFLISGSTVNLSANTVQASIGGVPASVALFALDRTPPVTQAAILGPSWTNSDGSLGFPSGDPIVLVASDAVSGVRQTYYFINGSTTVVTYTQPFTITGSSEVLTYFSVDRAGNWESTHTVVLEQISGYNTAQGLALAKDASGDFWEAVQQADGSISLGKYSTSAVLIGSTTLPGANDDGGWGVSFDSTGKAYALGTAQGYGDAQAAVYKVSSNGNVLLASATWDSGVGDSYVFGGLGDGTGHLFLTGAEQESNGDFSLALWHYTPSTV